MGGSGYFLSCEEHSPAELVEQARTAEQAGFESLWISDHYHPWHDGQGQSSFVCSVIGALSQAVSLPVETALTCPLVRIHPAVIAQAAATAAVRLGGRFRLGVGTGEALNEHILGTAWPESPVRLGTITSRPCPRFSTRGSTPSTSTRSARAGRASSTSTAPRSCRGCGTDT